MAFNTYGFKTLSHIGTIDGSAGTMRSLHGYVTNDDAAAVETSGYFDTVAARVKSGDQLQVSLDLDGTPSIRTYVMTNTANVITIARETSAVTGDQTTIAALTDSTGGTADGTVADVGATFSQATLNNNFADVAARITEIRAALIASGLIAAA